MKRFKYRLAAGFIFMIISASAQADSTPTTKLNFFKPSDQETYRVLVSYFPQPAQLNSLKHELVEATQDPDLLSTWQDRCLFQASATVGKVEVTILSNDGIELGKSSAPLSIYQDKETPSDGVCDFNPAQPVIFSGYSLDQIAVTFPGKNEDKIFATFQLVWNGYDQGGASFSIDADRNVKLISPYHFDAVLWSANSGNRGRLQLLTLDEFRNRYTKN